MVFSSLFWSLFDRLYVFLLKIVSSWWTFFSNSLYHLKNIWKKSVKSNSTIKHIQIRSSATSRRKKAGFLEILTHYFKFFLCGISQSLIVIMFFGRNIIHRVVSFLLCSHLTGRVTDVTTKLLPINRWVYENIILNKSKIFQYFHMYIWSKLENWSENTVYCLKSELLTLIDIVNSIQKHETRFNVVIILYGFYFRWSTLWYAPPVSWSPS